MKIAIRPDQASLVLAKLLELADGAMRAGMGRSHIGMFGDVPQRLIDTLGDRIEHIKSDDAEDQQ